MKKLLLVLVLMAVQAQSQERIWMTMPIERLQSLSDSLAFDTGKLDTVWRDTLVQEKNPRWVKPEKPVDPKEPAGDVGVGDEKPIEQDEPEFITVSQRVQRIVPRMAGGYTVSNVTVVDTLHTVVTAMIYTGKEKVAQLMADKSIVLLERVADKLDTVTTYIWKYIGHLDTLSRLDTLHLKFPVRDTIVTRTYIERVRDSVKVPIYTVTRVPTVVEKGSVPVKEQTDTKATLANWGIKTPIMDAKPWATYDDKKASTMTILKVQRKDLDGSEVTRRDQ